MFPPPLCESAPQVCVTRDQGGRHVGSPGWHVVLFVHEKVMKPCAMPAYGCHAPPAAVVGNLDRQPATPTRKLPAVTDGSRFDTPALLEPAPEAAGHESAQRRLGRDSAGTANADSKEEAAAPGKKAASPAAAALGRLAHEGRTSWRSFPSRHCYHARSRAACRLLGGHGGSVRGNH